MSGVNGSARSVSGTTSAPQELEVKIAVEELKQLCTSGLRALGHSEQDCSVIADVLMYAQLRGNNQGIIKIPTGGVDRLPEQKPPTVEHETRLSALINGNDSAGIVTLHNAMQLAKVKCREAGFGIVGTNHTSSSTGALGYYVSEIAKDGLLGFAMATSPEFVAPHGARQPVFGTNPIACAVPSGSGAPLVVDMATSAYTLFGLFEAKTAGRDIPEGVAYDSQGLPTTDPAAALPTAGGAIRVFDRSHKGSALALLVELLAGAAVSAAVEDKMSEKNWGNLIVAVDPGLLGDPAAFRSRVDAVLRRVKSAATVPGVDEVILPGERGDKIMEECLRTGMITVEANLLRDLRAVAARAPAVRQPAAASGRRLSTRLLHMASSVEDAYGPSAPPIYQTATFKQPSSTENGPYDYTRSGNPTRTMLEEFMAQLENADRGLAFTSGMAALTAVCRLCGSGDHIVAGDDLYGGTSRLLSWSVPNQGVEVSNVDTTDIAAVRAAIRPGQTKLVMLESPTNPRMQVCDLKALCELAHSVGAIVCVDNSIMAPIYQRPIELGADICMTSATKFIGGHSDVTAGILTVKGEELAGRLAFFQNAEGAGLAPFDSWLCLRGLKTMALRMEKQVANCEKIVKFLEAHPLVKRVNYPGSPSSDPAGYEIQRRQADNGGSLVSFTTDNVEVSKRIVEDTKLFKVTVSFGNVVSQISLPCFMSHASIPAEVRAARGLPDDLVRISCGIEDAEDLIADLDQAMKGAMQSVGMNPTQPDASDRLAPSSREAELMQKVADLEARLRAMEGAQQADAVSEETRHSLSGFQVHL
eukprot:CAMPEP_0177610046 /NCGR_PEP_ID=MMETSP0419_2-20121207/19517_1 /TAXON_ID=582737 /ORGANISM="Tetraselmis sp., Strain GSL018" /LENGTH=812 /DNA_ID=CAMNT_0019105219 /DNA_START=292 /DNA_END=2727 /DNA_ORIENTATION=-